MRTGPRTPEGKQSSSANSITHGCTSNKLILPDENEQDWEDLKQSWLDDYQPDTSSLRSLLLETAEAEWLLRRNARRYNQAEQSAYENYGDAITWPEETHKQLERFNRYRTTAERRFHRFQQAVELFRKNRIAESLSRERLRLAAQKEERQQETHDAWRADRNENRDRQLAEEVERNKPSLIEQYYAARKDFKPVPNLVQYVNVRVVNDQTVTRQHPSNEALIEKSKTMDPPPQKIFRELFLHPGLDIVEYEWAVRDLPGTSDCRSQEMTFRQWLRTIEREKQSGSSHVGPAEPDDDPVPALGVC